MSIDYSNVKAMSDHIGDIVKITDASGNVMWKQAPSGATVKITVSGVTAPGRGMGSVTIDGVNYDKPTSIVVPFGTVIVCKANGAYISPYGEFGGVIKLNGTVVAPFVSGVSPTTYEYTVNKDVLIDFSNIGSPSGIYATILITEQ